MGCVQNKIGCTARCPEGRRGRHIPFPLDLHATGRSHQTPSPGYLQPGWLVRIIMSGNDPRAIAIRGTGAAAVPPAWLPVRLLPLHPARRRPRAPPPQPPSRVPPLAGSAPPCAPAAAGTAVQRRRHGSPHMRAALPASSNRACSSPAATAAKAGSSDGGGALGQAGQQLPPRRRGALAAASRKGTACSRRRLRRAAAGWAGRAPTWLDGYQMHAGQSTQIIVRDHQS